MYRYIIFYFFLLISLLLFFYSDKKNYDYLINEEAIPIRDYDVITGMDYSVDIDDSIKDNSIDIYSKIISSIYHYKDINSINNFFVNLKIDNDYKITDISIVDKDNNKIIINLDREDFINYNLNYYIRIKLKRNTRKI